jgi:DUF4097 and DUF4098 domain-containing protein YvlB
MKAPLRVFLVACPLFLLETGCGIENFAGEARFTDDFHYSYGFKPGGSISVHNQNGSVEIAGWDKDKVEINGTKFASSHEALDRIRIDIDHTGGSIAIRTVVPGDRYFILGAKYVIHVPRQSKLDRIVSSNGSVRVNDIGDDVTLRTSNGSIHIGNVRGRVSAETSNGGIEGQNLDGACKVETSNGSIHLSQLRGTVEATSSNGGITVRLPSGAKADVEAETSNGAVTSDFAELTQHSSEKNRLHGEIGGGGPPLRLTTSNASIHIERE